MSTAYALAAVTAVLRRRLLDRMAASDVASVVGTIPVTASPPDRLGDNGEPTQLNVYLHRVTPNQGWRNAGLPERDGNGLRVAAPPLAIDLHYLLTAYGAEPYVAEILLGHAMQAMHDEPVLTRDEVEAALSPATPDPLLPPAIAASELAQQVEQVRFTLETIPSEESSRMWSALQAHYRMTAPYLATVVLVDAVRGGRTSLPARGVASGAADIGAPAVTSVTAGGDPAAAIDLTTTLVVTGRNLALEGTGFALGLVELTLDDVMVVAPGEVHIDLAALAVKPPAGALALQLHRSVDVGGGAVRRVVSSPQVPVVIRPSVSAPAATISHTDTIGGTPYRTGALEVTADPAVRVDQRVRVLLNGTAADRPGYTLDVPLGNGIVPPATTTTTVTVPFARVRAGDYVVRLEVDSAQSIPGMSGGVYATPAVTI
jgi:hypothetical protein